MLKDRIKISNLHHKEHLEWLNLLDFYQEQILIYQEDLLLTFHQHPKYWSIIEHVTEYRRIFLKKLKMIDNLRHEIILLEKQLSEELYQDAPLTVEAAKTRRRMDKFVEKFELLKISFRKFVAKNS
jgi:hypothetical protein